MIQELFEYIESLQFSSRTNLANNFRSFIRALNLEGAQERLFHLASIGDNAQIVFERVKTLASQQSELDYENPADAALAVYLRVLFYLGSPKAISAAEIVSDAPRLWWAEFVSRAIRRSIRSLGGEISLAPQNAAIISIYAPAQAAPNLADDFWSYPTMPEWRILDDNSLETIALPNGHGATS